MRWTVNRATIDRSPGGAGQFVIDHEILSTVIRTVPVLWYIQKLSVPANSSAGKVLDSLPRNDAVAELCSSIFNVFRKVNYQHHQHIMARKAGPLLDTNGPSQNYRLTAPLDAY
jgi:hypothetical protein